MMVSRLRSRSTMMQSLHPTTRQFLRAISILAAVGCIATLFLSESEDEAYLKAFDFDPRQLSPIDDPKTLEQRDDIAVASYNNADEADESKKDENQSLLFHTHDNIDDPLMICGRPTNVPSIEPTTNIQKYSTCTPITKDKPILMIRGSRGFGRTGNQLIEFLKAIQHSRDHGVQLGIMHGSWGMNVITRMWMAQNETEQGGQPDFGTWIKRFEETFCVKVFTGNKEFSRGGWKVDKKKPRDMFRFNSRIPIPDYADSQQYNIRALFRHYNKGVEYSTDGKHTRDMCSGIKSLFPSDDEDEAADLDPSSAIYSVIHSRSFGQEGQGGSAGVTLLRGVSNHAKCDPLAALEMRPDYIKSILQPLGMLEHPIVFISDGQDPHVLERLRADPDIGPRILVPPYDKSWIGGDITLGTLANVFIGNPASTFTTFIAKARLALGFGHNYLFRAKDEHGEWQTVCNDHCIFNHRVMNVMA